MKARMSLNSQCNPKKKEYWRYYNTLSQTTLQSHGNKNSITLVQKQRYRPTAKKTQKQSHKATAAYISKNNILLCDNVIQYIFIILNYFPQLLSQPTSLPFPLHLHNGVFSFMIFPHQVQFVFSNYCQEWGLPWSVVNPQGGATSLKKIGFPSSSSHLIS